jgi:hypothetical protein
MRVLLLVTLGLLGFVQFANGHNSIKPMKHGRHQIGNTLSHYVHKFLDWFKSLYNKCKCYWQCKTAEHKCRRPLFMDCRKPTRNCDDPQTLKNEMVCVSLIEGCNFSGNLSYGCFSLNQQLWLTKLANYGST